MEYLVSILTPVIIAACPLSSPAPQMQVAPPTAAVLAPVMPVSPPDAPAERLSTQWEHRTMLIPTNPSTQIYTKTSQSRPAIRPAILTRVRDR
ncbi:MAG TPA: hypothetical protein VHB77_23140 [Planctomycetaceae bacterium]|nr:hypothetical protein [Planctomycetaceae bacterium]